MSILGLCMFCKKKIKLTEIKLLNVIYTATDKIYSVYEERWVELGGFSIYWFLNKISCEVKKQNFKNLKKKIQII